MNRQQISWCLVALALVLSGGCNSKDSRSQLYESPYPDQRVVAVTVFANMSGSEALDPLAVTEEFYAELQGVDGLSVIPIERVLRAQHVLELNAVDTYRDAMELAEQLHADIVLVGAVTQYDPYYPPRVGIVVQLYDRKPRGVRPAAGLDPADFARQGRPFATEPTPTDERPATTLARIYDCDDAATLARVQAYAQERTSVGRPGGWQHYTRSRGYLRFVTHEVVGELLALEQSRLLAPPRVETQRAYYDAAGDM